MIEVMISVVLGLILVGSVLALVVTTMQSNAETIRSTRITQELRTLVEVVGREVERARFMGDPLVNIGNPPDPSDPTAGASNPNGLIDDSQAGCLRFSYFDPEGGGTNNTAITFNLEDGTLFVGRQADAASEDWTDPDGDTRKRTALVGCDDAATPLSSPEIVIDEFNVSVLDDADADADGWVDCAQPDSIVELEIVGSFAAGNDLAQRRVVDRVRVGSVDLKLLPSCY